jgi:hypothetical protein
LHIFAKKETGIVLIEAINVSLKTTPHL